MSENRPMNANEGALFSALMALTKAIAHGETDRVGLAAAFRDAAAEEKELVCRRSDCDGLI